MLGVPSGCFGRHYTAPERKANEAHPHRSPLLFFYPYVRGEHYKWDKVIGAKTKSEDKVSEGRYCVFQDFMTKRLERICLWPFCRGCAKTKMGGYGDCGEGGGEAMTLA